MFGTGKGTTCIISSTVQHEIQVTSSEIQVKVKFSKFNITQVTLLTNVTRYLSNIVTVTNLILRNIITTSNEVTNSVSNPLSNA